MATLREFRKKLLISRSLQILTGGVIVSLILVMVLVTGLIYFNMQLEKAKQIRPLQKLKTFVVEGSSMEPTLKDGQEIQVDLIYYRLYEIKREDIVALALNDKYYVKRVIAISGDSLEVKDGNLWISGEKTNDFFVSDKNYKFTEEELKFLYLNNGSRTVPENSVLVLSDNRVFNFDSRKFSYLATSKILGKVVSY